MPVSIARSHSGLRAEARAELLEMDLSGLRELLGKTQEELAALLERSQGQVSETERRQDVLLSTLRSYVKALGGELEVIANFGDKRILRLKKIAKARRSSPGDAQDIAFLEARRRTSK